MRHYVQNSRSRGQDVDAETLEHKAAVMSSGSRYAVMFPTDCYSVTHGSEATVQLYQSQSMSCNLLPLRLIQTSTTFISLGMQIFGGP
jgi:hypothetical protein